MVAAARRDPTGDAYLGLKGGVVDHVLSQATSGNRVRGDALANALNDPETMRVMRAVLPNAELSRLRVIATQLSKLDIAETVSAADIENAPNQLVATFLQVQAARAGRAVGTGTIQAPGIFVNRVTNAFNRLSIGKADQLIHDALEDPQLLRALLTGPGSSKARIDQSVRVLNNWAIGALGAETAEQQPLRMAQ